tara:strand:+ start:2521 stop:2751 length:231 start_codon:yes stop_codon:yes gene_type:complete
MMRIPIEQHKPWPGKIYKFYVVDDNGHVLEGGLPSIEDCWFVIGFLKETSNGNYNIEVEQIHRKKPGFGRDPDIGV